MTIVEHIGISPLHLQKVKDIIEIDCKYAIYDTINKLKPTKEDWILYNKPEPNWHAIMWNDRPYETGPGSGYDYGECLPHWQYLVNLAEHVRRSNGIYKQKQREFRDQKKPFRNAVNNLVKALLDTGSVKTSKEAYNIIWYGLRDEYPGLTREILYECFDKYNKSRWHE